MNAVDYPPMMRNIRGRGRGFRDMAAENPFWSEQPPCVAPPAEDLAGILRPQDSTLSKLQVVTTGVFGVEHVGVTVHGFTVLSFSPPRVLWGLRRGTPGQRAFRLGSLWGLHLLTEEQRNRLERIETEYMKPLAGLELEPGVAGLPLLREHVGRLQCRTTRRYAEGEYVILVGDVFRAERGSEDSQEPSPRDAKEIFDNSTATNQKSKICGGVPADSTLGHLIADTYLRLFSPIWDQASVRGLNELEFLVLSILAARKGRSLRDFHGLVHTGGRDASPDVLNDLCARDFIRIEDPDDSDGDELDAHLFLTPQGEACLGDIAAMGQIEEDLGRQLGASGVSALRQLLRRLLDPTLQGDQERCV